MPKRLALLTRKDARTLTADVFLVATGAQPPVLLGSLLAGCGVLLANQLGERAMLEFDPDIGGGPGRSVSWGPLREALDFRQLEWPGHGAPENASYQYLDREYLRAE